MLNTIFALDFDGVLCDSAVETAISGWHVAKHFDNSLPEYIPDEVLADFRLVRPILETGYEAVLICYGLYHHIEPNAFLAHFDQHISELTLRLKTDSTALKAAFGAYRDHWMTNNLADWIAMNPLYPHVKTALQKIPSTNNVIITTKQERFVKAILAANEIMLPDAQIYGLDRQLKKTQILAMLKTDQPNTNILFVEDRRLTLENVLTQPELNDIQLAFASWGYNTEQDKAGIRAQAERIRYLENPIEIIAQRL